MAGRTEGKLTFQPLRRQGFQWWLETSDVQELAAALEERPRIQTWDGFCRAGPWGDEGSEVQEGGISGVQVEFAGWRQLAGALGVAEPQLEGVSCGVELPLALVAALAGLPLPVACARELSWACGAGRRAMS